MRKKDAKTSWGLAAAWPKCNWKVGKCPVLKWAQVKSYVLKTLRINLEFQTLNFNTWDPAFVVLSIVFFFSISNNCLSPWCKLFLSILVPNLVNMYFPKKSRSWHCLVENTERVRLFLERHVWHFKSQVWLKGFTISAKINRGVLRKTLSVRNQLSNFFAKTSLAKI